MNSCEDGRHLNSRSYDSFAIYLDATIPSEMNRTR